MSSTWRSVTCLWGLYSQGRRSDDGGAKGETTTFYILYIAVALIYSYRGGILASFLSSAVAVCLYPPIIL